jgi:hypothetical protein
MSSIASLRGAAMPTKPEKCEAAATSLSSIGRRQPVTELCLFATLGRAVAIVAEMPWKVETKEPVKQWQRSLDQVTADRFTGTLARLEERGPQLGRPFADTIKGSQHHKMKELRVGNMRALYAFDARRTAVVLVAGDKTNDWKGWYRRNIPVADRMFEQHQQSIGGGGRRWQARTSAQRPKERGR